MSASCEEWVELRSFASGKTATQFQRATRAYRANGQEKAEFQCKRRVYRPR
jgi:hypothetical protein